VEAGPQLDVLDRPRGGLVGGAAQGADLGRERIAVRVVLALVDRRVTELVDRGHEGVAHRAGAVPVEDELHQMFDVK
jgi:hypothetical protein